MKKSLMQPKNWQQNASKRANHLQQPRPLLEMPPTVETRRMRRRQQRISSSGVASRTRSAVPKRDGRIGDMEELIEFRRRFASAESRQPNLAIPTNFDEEELRRLPLLLARLETAMHFWEVAKPKEMNEWGRIFDETEGSGFARIRPLDGRIPDNYGLLLDSDLPSMNDQLAGIRQNLVQLRQFGFSQPTAEYFQHYRRPLPNEFHRPKTFSGIFRANLRGATESPLPTLAQIRAHLLNMEFHVEKRIRELTTERKKLGGDENIKSSRNPLERMEWPIPPAPVGKKQTTVQFEENLQKRPIQSAHQSSIPTYPFHVRHESSFVPSQSHQNIWTKQNDEGIFQETLEEANNSPPLSAPVTAPSNVDDRSYIRPLVFGKNSHESDTQKYKGMENVEELKLTEENAKNDERPKTEKGVDNVIVAPANEGGVVGQTQGEENTNFQRMLQVLKNPRRFDLSSSSFSSTDEEAGGRPTKLPLKEMTPTNLQKNPSPSSQPLATTSTSFGASFPGFKDMGQQKRDGDSDSDSDFFK